jgi:hypothetical protein
VAHLERVVSAILAVALVVGSTVLIAEALDDDGGGHISRGAHRRHRPRR